MAPPNPPTYGQLPVQLDPTAWAGRTYSPALGMGIDDIQNQMSTQLTNFFASLDPAVNIPVYIYPCMDPDTWWASDAIAFILISYRSTTYPKPIATSGMVQERTLQFDIHVEARTSAWKLSGPGSVYDLIYAIICGLDGFQPNGCRRAYFTEERFSRQDQTGKVWLYDLTYNVVTVRPMLLPQYALANLQQMTTTVEPSGDEVVSPPAVPPIAGGE